MVQDKASLLRLAPRALYSALYAVAVAYMLSHFAEFRHPVYGYAWMPLFEIHREADTSESFQRARHLPVEHGYDGQFYAQLAVDPLLREPGTIAGMDVPLVRARRILFSMIPFAFAGGEPDRAVQLYCFQNFVSWALIALLLLRWFPPTDWQNAFRYLALLYTSGFVTSITRALIDGPSMALLLIAMILLEKRRQTAGALLLGLGGLGRETAILGAAALRCPNWSDKREMLRWTGRLAMVAAPLALWMLYVNGVVGQTQYVPRGFWNLGVPMAGWWEALRRVVSDYLDYDDLVYVLWRVAVLLAIPIQIAALLLRPDWRSAWWRLGAAYAALGLTLGIFVWEGPPAAPRVLLPMTFAFNILLSRAKRWIPVLLLGNLLALVGWWEIAHTQPPRAEFRLSESYLDDVRSAGTTLPKAQWAEGWYGQEQSSRRFWRWGKNGATLRFEHPLETPAAGSLAGELMSLNDRAVSILANGELVERIVLNAGQSAPIALTFALTQGANTIVFQSEEISPDVPGDTRNLDFALYDFRLDVDSPNVDSATPSQ